ncbi:MAG: four helix bundle protein [Candidatus Peribacteraceae bacterium]|nr:four helix bundle protein [Candidatus Peribacteraceae bacterium]
MDDFMDLKAAQVAMDLVEEIYRLCRKLPKEETYGLVSQLKRASTSIVANIAEGFGRYTYLDKAHHFTIARGECAEARAHLLIAVRVRMLSSEEIQMSLSLVCQTGRLLSGLIFSSRKRAISPLS